MKLNLNLFVYLFFCTFLFCHCSYGSTLRQAQGERDKGKPLVLSERKRDERSPRTDNFNFCISSKTNTEKAHLRNKMTIPKLQLFKKTVEKQVQLFPETFYLENNRSLPVLKYKFLPVYIYPTLSGLHVANLYETMKIKDRFTQFFNTFYLRSFFNSKKIALTFDDGPDETYTKEILNILKQKNVPATFFLVGENIENYPELTKKINNLGHAIGGHTYNHARLTELPPKFAYKTQIQKTQKIFKDILGFEPLFFRPPYGAITDEQIKYFGNKGFKIINWSIDSFDWDDTQNNYKEIIKLIKTYIHDGAIILMHSGGKDQNNMIGDRSNTVKALPYIIDLLQSMGYEFCTVPELLNISAKK